MAPVDELIVNPPVDENIPPVYNPVPVKVTACAELTLAQNGVPE